MDFFFSRAYTSIHPIHPSMKCVTDVCYGGDFDNIMKKKRRERRKREEKEEHNE